MTNYSKNGIEVDGSLIVVIDDFLTTGKYDGTILPSMIPSLLRTGFGVGC